MKRIIALLVTAALCAVVILPAMVSGQRPDKAEKLARAEAASLKHLQKKLAKKGIAANDVKTLRVFEDTMRADRAHTHFQQTYNGIPVFGGEAIVHLDTVTDSEARPATDNLIAGVDVSTTPNLSAADAIAAAKGKYKEKKGCDECLTDAPTADLWVLRHEGVDYLTYRVQLARLDGTEETSEPVYFIDALSGAVVWSYDNLQTQSATGSGVSLYSGTQSINTYRSGANYYMENHSRGLGTFDNRNTARFNIFGGISSYGTIYHYTDADNVWNATAQKAGVDAHFGASKVYDYFLNVHGRNGIDGSGGPRTIYSINGTTTLVSSIVHFGKSYNNAFWSSSRNQMFYGDGDGAQFNALVTLDICGHEMQHGITSRTAGLIYSGESGALNESWSDAFGVMVELYARGGVENANTWRIGEDAYTPATSGDALRYMDTPHSAGNYGYTTNDDPDHYTERYTGTGDNGGVHINSGIPNHVFYLVVKGGTHAHIPGPFVTGIGPDKAAKIWYRALTTYMTSSTNFAGARTATLNAAADLYGTGSVEYTAVANAWTACGVL